MRANRPQDAGAPVPKGEAMPLTFTFPTNVILNLVLQEYVTARDRLRGLKIAPFLDFQTQKVRWDLRDNVRGLTKSHVMGTDPKIDIRPGSVLKEYDPFYFKEADLIKEDEILRGRELGTLGGVVSLDNEIARTMKSRVDRNFLRAEWLIWGMLTGSIVLNDDNVKATETFPIQTFDASDWTNHGTATPLKDFNAVLLKFRGTGAGAQGAVAYMNQTTLNNLLENTNDDDIRGFRSQNFLALTYDLEQVNKILQTRGLPTIEVYDEGYYDDNGAFQLFIPNDKVVVVGKRASGEVVGNFALTPSLHREMGGMPAPGFFSFITVNGDANNGAAQINLSSLGGVGNPKIEIIGGMYGGPILWYPRSIVRMDVGA
jgi:hypothetical protein